MATHSLLTGTDLHENKGADTATAGQVLSGNGLGGSAFVNPSTLTNVVLNGDAVGSSSVSQAPGATDTGIAVTFDNTSDSTDATVAAGGTFTIVNTGLYYIHAVFNAGRTAGAANMVFAMRMRKSGAQFGPTRFIQTSLTNTIQNIVFSGFLKLNAADTISFQMLRDSSGDNSGGLIPLNLVSGTWDDAFSARVQMNRVVGGV